MTEEQSKTLHHALIASANEFIPPQAVQLPEDAAIMERTPNGECIEVQYHPNGDWSVGLRPVQATPYLHDMQLSRLPERDKIVGAIASWLDNDTTISSLADAILAMLKGEG